MDLDVLFEDNHCLAVNKPAGLLSQGDISGEPSLVEGVASYLKIRYQKPGNVYVGLLHRLDRPTSGVVLLAKTSKAAARLSDQFRSGTISKVYWAIVEGLPRDDEGEWIDRLEKDGRTNRVGVVAEESASGKEARVTFRVVERGERFSKLELRPGTGRGHQLRVQLATRGLPILGDRKYGATTRLTAGDGRPRIALHARTLTFIHPTRREAISVEAPVPADWPESSSGWWGRSSGSSRPAAGSSP
jgi:23S rRNA pseudouridine1911/1915/1917 synthase